MVMSSITVKGITPDLSILGAYQRLVFANVGSNNIAFQTDNMFVPTSLLTNYINWETRNNTLSGYRWIHATTSLSTIGTLSLQSFANASANGSNILTIAEDATLSITTPTSFGSNLSLGGFKIINLGTPTLGTDAVNKNYVDTMSPTITLTGAVTGTGSGTINTTLTAITTSQISNFNSSVTAFRLDQFAAPTASVSLNSQKITNLATPTLSTDAVNKSYVDAISPTITLTGAVTGTGSGTITTTLTPITVSQITNFNSSVVAFRLDQFAAPTASVSLNSQKITNLATPTLGTDAANKSYVDTAATITLTGAVTGTGSGTISTTLTAITTSQISNFNSSVTAFRLDQFAVPTSSVSLNSQKITSLATPTVATDAATKAYVDAGDTITLTGAVTGTGSGTIATTLTAITTSQISNFNSSVTAFRLDQFAAPTASVSMNSQKITNLATPTSANDAANKTYIDTLRLDQIAAPTASVSLNSQKIINLATPTLSTDATTKAYVDAGDAKAYATVLLTSNATSTTIATAGTYVKVAGTTTSPLSSVFTVATTNQVTYPGTPNINARANVALHFTPAGIPALGSATVSFTIFKNGVSTTALSPITVTVRNNGDTYSISLTTIMPMVTSDHIEVWATTSNNAVSITVQNMNFNVIQV